MKAKYILSFLMFFHMLLNAQDAYRISFDLQDFSIENTGGILSISSAQHDCFLLWDRRFFEELAPDAQLDLICRVPARYGQHALIEEYVRRMQARQHSDKRYYLFGFLPVLKSRMRGNKTKYYLFGVLPLWKVKEAGCPVYAK